MYVGRVNNEVDMLFLDTNVPAAYTWSTLLTVHSIPFLLSDRHPGSKRARGIGDFHGAYILTGTWLGRVIRPVFRKLHASGLAVDCMHTSRLIVPRRKSTVFAYSLGVLSILDWIGSFDDNRLIIASIRQLPT